MKKTLYSIVLGATLIGFPQLSSANVQLEDETIRQYVKLYRSNALSFEDTLIMMMSHGVRECIKYNGEPHRKKEHTRPIRNSINTFLIEEGFMKVDEKVSPHTFQLPLVGIEIQELTCPIYSPQEMSKSRQKYEIMPNNNDLNFRPKTEK